MVVQLLSIDNSIIYTQQKYTKRSIWHAEHVWGECSEMILACNYRAKVTVQFTVYRRELGQVLLAVNVLSSLFLTNVQVGASNLNLLLNWLRFQAVLAWINEYHNVCGKHHHYLELNIKQVLALFTLLTRVN